MQAMMFNRAKGASYEINSGSSTENSDFNNTGKNVDVFHIMAETREKTSSRNSLTRRQVALIIGVVSVVSIVASLSSRFIPVRYIGENINDCAATPCLNGGGCKDLNNGYKCTCAAGFRGRQCEININECTSDPCQNGATCNDGINRYTCGCPAGYAGTQCEINVNECASDPCQNGATCNDGINGYTCSCAQKSSGTHCEEEGYIGDRCFTAADCQVEHSECRPNGICGCVVGYSFKESTHSCEANCTEYGTTFQSFPLHLFWGHDVFHQITTVDVCRQLCVQASSYVCRAFDFWNGNCHHKDADALEYPSDYHSGPHTHYQRNCA